MNPTIIHADCLEQLARMSAASVHSVVTDPPYHLTTIVKRFANTPRNEKTVGKHAYGRHAAGFMGKRWDGGDIAFTPELWSEVLRVMKPGAYLIAFASTRGYHRMVCAIEDAGFIIHPMLGWIFGSGFPKATRFKCPDMDGWRYGLQALKPALEPICMAQKPMDGTGTENWLAHGCGGLNIEGCRIATADVPTRRKDEPSMLQRYANEGSTNFAAIPGQRRGAYKVKRLKPGATLNATGGNWRPEEGPDYEGFLPDGRWPANVVHDGCEEVLSAFPEAPGQQRATGPAFERHATVYGSFTSVPEHHPRNDEGSAARFFYCAKADADDRAWSKHPTVKPLALMRWLVRLITPPGGTILDCFAGSGTTLEAARLEGFQAIGIEREAEYVADIHRRLGRASGADTPLFAEAP